MIYASKTPRDLNRDPEPFRDELGHRWILPVTFQPRTFTHDPRPEFDHVQHNEPNPILVEFRRNTYVGKAAHYLSYLDEGDVYDWRSFSAGVKAHARKVLTRLINFRS